MWMQIKKALNSTLGRKDFNSLDVVNDINAYWQFYMTATYIKDAGIYASLDVKFFAKKTIELGDTSTGCVLPPWIEEIVGGAKVSQGTILPPLLKKIGANAFNFGDWGEGIRLPYNVKEIDENAFALLYKSNKVIINNKRGAIAGHPWGHPAGDDGIVYLYE